MFWLVGLFWSGSSGFILGLQNNKKTHVKVYFKHLLLLDFASCILEVEEVVFSTVTQVVINDVNDVSLLFKRPSKP